MKDIFPNNFFPSFRAIWRMAWDLDETALVEFSEVILSVLPVAILLMNSSGEKISCSSKPTIFTFCLLSYRNFNSFLLFKRSNNFPQ